MRLSRAAETLLIKHSFPFLVLIGFISANSSNQGATTLSITTLSIMTFSIMTLSKMTLRIMTLNIRIFSIT
jgi:hypothetical protein